MENREWPPALLVEHPGTVTGQLPEERVKIFVMGPCALNRLNLFDSRLLRRK